MRDADVPQKRQRGPQRAIQRAETVAGASFTENAAKPAAHAALPPSPNIVHGVPLGPNNTSISVQTQALHQQANGGPVGTTRPANWPKFTSMLGGGRNPFVQGHALSQKLGGLGNQNNLSPFTRSLNALHRNRAEKQVINHTKATGNNEYADYDVMMNYGGNAPLVAWAHGRFGGLPLLKQLAGMTVAGLITVPAAGAIKTAGGPLPLAQQAMATAWITTYVNNTFPTSIDCTATFVKGPPAVPVVATTQQKINITNHMP